MIKLIPVVMLQWIVIIKLIYIFVPYLKKEMHSVSADVQEKLVLKRSCGRTVSRNLAQFMCASSTLRTVEINRETVDPISFHEDFFELLAAKGRNSAASDMLSYKPLYVVVDLIIITNEFRFTFQCIITYFT